MERTVYGITGRSRIKSSEREEREEKRGRKV